MWFDEGELGAVLENGIDEGEDNQVQSFLRQMFGGTPPSQVPENE